MELKEEGAQRTMEREFDSSCHAEVTEGCWGFGNLNLPNKKSKTSPTDKKFCIFQANHKKYDGTNKSYDYFCVTKIKKFTDDGVEVFFAIFSSRNQYILIILIKSLYSTKMRIFPNGPILDSHCARIHTRKICKKLLGKVL